MPDTNSAPRKGSPKGRRGIRLKHETKPPVGDAPMLAAALAHAAAGRHVFPCRPDKKPHTAHGFHDATRDPATIRGWWAQWPDALIGMPTGKVNKVFVIDVDNDPATGKDGDAALAVLEQAHGHLPATVETMTPRGGRHLFFRHPGEDLDIPNSASKLGPNLDVRGDGGYVILPPSVLPDGRQYLWEGSSDPGEGVRAAEAPAWLLALVVKQDQAPPVPTGPIADSIPEGQRNETLFALGRSLRAKGLTDAAILAALHAENAARCAPPLSGAEVQIIAASAAKKAPGRSPEFDRAHPRPRLAVVSGVPRGTQDDPPPRRPLVTIRAGELSRVCDEAQAALEDADCGIYRQGSRLVRIGRAADLDEDDNERRGKREPAAPTLHQLNKASTVDAMSRYLNWQKWDARSEKDVPCDPPTQVAEIFLSREGQWRFRRLVGFTECPCVAPSGRLIAAAGYDNPSQLMVLPHALDGTKIPRSPLPDAAEQAVKDLREWLSTFPFATPADESAALAGALTAVHRRPLSAGPLIAITASTPATGKSRLAESFGVLATGRTPAFFTAGHTPEELEKRLDAILLTGDQVAVLDNLERPLKSDALCSMTTQPIKTVRVLGGSKSVDCPTNTTLVLTGNNLTLLGDLQRRTLLVRLDAGVERPEERIFTRNPIAYTRQQRAALLRAAIVLPLAYAAAGRPDLGSAPYGGFEEWDAIVRRPLIWAGMPDPLAAAVSMRDEDHELVGMRFLFPAWWSLWGEQPVMPSKVIEAAREADNPMAHVQTGPSADLAEALRGILGDAPGKLSAQALGYRLRAWQGRILDGYRITRAPRSTGGVRYALARVLTM